MSLATLCNGRINILWPTFSLPMYVFMHSVLILQKGSTKRDWRDSDSHLR